jgi:HK97 family phage major capsid protein
MNRIELLKALIAKATDKAEIDKLNKELIDAIREDEREKIAKEAQTKADETARAEALKKSADGKPAQQVITVGPPALYKGRQFHREREALGDLLSQKHVRHATDEKWLERQTKGWLDMIAAGMGGSALKPKGSPMYIGKAGMDEGVVGSGVEGGYLVAPEYLPEILSYAREESVALRICRNWPMNAMIQYVPKENAKVSVAATAEASDATETTPTFTQRTLTAKRWDAFGMITNELLEDAYMPILPMLVSQFMEAIGVKVDSAVFDATGDPMSNVFTAAAGYSQVFSTGSSNFSEILYTDFTKALAKISAKRKRGGVWAIHRTPLWTYINSLRDSNGRPLFTDPIAGTPAKILGYPVEELENGPSATAASTAIACFGDFKGVVIGHRSDAVDLKIDPYTYMKSNQTMFCLFTRWAFDLALSLNFVRIITAA